MRFPGEVERLDVVGPLRVGAIDEGIGGELVVDSRDFSEKRVHLLHRPDVERRGHEGNKGDMGDGKRSALTGLVSITMSS